MESPDNGLELGVEQCPPEEVDEEGGRDDVEADRDLGRRAALERRGAVRVPGTKDLLKITL